MKLIKRILGVNLNVTNSQRPNLTDNMEEQDTIFNLLNRQFPLINFSREFCDFYAEHDWVYSILFDYHTYMKMNPTLKLSDLICDGDGLELFDWEYDYFLDLAYYNDSEYLINTCINKGSNEILEKLYKKGYLEDYHTPIGTSKTTVTIGKGTFTDSVEQPQA
jgi:hypothetical protein